jgi:hypothetical protein
MRPNQRELHIRNNVRNVDPLVDIILSGVEGPERDAYLQACPIKESKLKKGYVEASLLCTNDFEAISNILELPVEVVRMYSAIFYDVTECDKLSKMELLDVRDKNEANLKLWALSQGLEFIAWRMGKQIQISPVDGLVDLFTTCMYKSKEAMFSGNVAEASKEATKWVKLSVDISRLLKLWTVDSGAAKKDLELAIREVIPDFDGFTSLDGFDISEFNNLPVRDVSQELNDSEDEPDNSEES